MKIVFSDKKTGKTGQVEVAKGSEGMLIGKKMKDVIDGSVAGLDGYKLLVTGLSDSAGSPSRPEIDGTRKAKTLIANGPGIAHPKKGFRSRRSVRGSVISTDTAQVNTVITEYGTKPVEELFKPKEAKKEE